MLIYLDVYRLLMFSTPFWCLSCWIGQSWKKCSTMPTRVQFEFGIIWYYPVLLNPVDQSMIKPRDASPAAWIENFGFGSCCNYTSTVDALENCNLVCIESTACFLQIVLLCKLQTTTNNSPLMRLPVHLGREAFGRSHVLLFPGRLLCCYELVTDTRNLLARHFYVTFMVTSISGP